MKTRDKIICRGLPQALVGALAAALGPEAEIAAEQDMPDADLLLHAAAAPPPRTLMPAAPRLGVDTAQPQRLGSLLRRARQMIDAPAFYLDDLSIGPALFQPQEKSITAQDGKATLTDKEVDILLCLARQGGKALKREDLLRRVWRYQSGVDTHTLETHVYRLRQKLAALGGLDGLLITDDDGGYRLGAPAAPAPETAEKDA